MKPIRTSMNTCSSRTPEVRPWTPTQIFAVTFLFGIFAGSMCMAVNFGRLHERKKAIGWLVSGLILTAITTLFCLKTNVPPSAAPVLGVVAGLFFLVIQKPDFDAWKTVHWDSITSEAYQPSHLGQLFACAMLSLGLHVTALFLLVA